MTKIMFGILLGSVLMLRCDSEGDCKRPKECELSPDGGLCKAYFPKYYFDKAEGKCKEFVWGGCGGVVPFDTLEKCNACKCASSSNE